MQFRKIALLALFTGLAAVAHAQGTSSPKAVEEDASAALPISGASVPGVVNPFTRKSQAATTAPALESPPSRPVGEPLTGGAEQAPRTALKPPVEQKPIRVERAIETLEESVQGTRIGMVNDLHIFRGNGTYFFERKSNLKVVRKLNKAPEVAGTPSTETAPAAAGNRAPSLKPPSPPAFTGRPLPAPATGTAAAKPSPWGAQKLPSNSSAKPIANQATSQ